jgi:nitroreductase
VAVPRAASGMQAVQLRALARASSPFRAGCRREIFIGMIEELIASRRSIRRFKPEAPDRAILERMLEMAILAPSASNKQPWRFFVVGDKAAITRMASAVQAAVDRIVPHVRAEFMEAFRAYGNYFVRFQDAPIVIVPIFKELVVLSNLIDDQVSPDDRTHIAAMEFNSGLISIGLALQNMMLFAHSIGVGTSCMTGPLLAADELRRELDVPESWRIAAVVPTGFPDEMPAPTTRKTIDAVVRWR